MHISGVGILIVVLSKGHVHSLLSDEMTKFPRDPGRCHFDTLIRSKGPFGKLLIRFFSYGTCHSPRSKKHGVCIHGTCTRSVTHGGSLSQPDKGGYHRDTYCSAAYNARCSVHMRSDSFRQVGSSQQASREVCDGLHSQRTHSPWMTAPPGAR